MSSASKRPRQSARNAPAGSTTQTRMGASRPWEASELVDRRRRSSMPCWWSLSTPNWSWMADSSVRPAGPPPMMQTSYSAAIARARSKSFNTGWLRVTLRKGARLNAGFLNGPTS